MTIHDPSPTARIHDLGFCESTGEALALERWEREFQAENQAQAR